LLFDWRRRLRVSRQDGESVVALDGGEDGGQADSGSGVSPDGLGNDPVRVQEWADLTNGVALLAVGDHPDAVGRDHTANPLDRLDEHGRVTNDWEKVFRAGKSALRPETFSFASCHDDDRPVHEFEW